MPPAQMLTSPRRLSDPDPGNRLPEMSRPEIAGESDEVLTERILAGDDVAFEALVARYQQRVYRLARRMSRSDSDAEEVLQETFLQVYRKVKTFRGDSKLSTWLYRVATNAALMHRRQRDRHPTDSLEAYLPRYDESGRHARLDADHSVAARADELIDRQRLAGHAREAVDRLPEIYRMAFVLRDLEEMSSGEVADVLGVDPTVVRQRVHRARLMLRGYLSHLVGVEP